MEIAELKETDIENRMCYYLDSIVKVKDFNNIK